MTFAFIFSDVGFGEWIVLLAVILVVVGPRRLPEAARKFGNVYSKFRRAADSFKRQLMDMDTEFDRTIAEAEAEANKAFAMPEDPESQGDGSESSEDEYAGYDGPGRSGEEDDYPSPGYDPSEDMAGDDRQPDAAESASSEAVSEVSKSESAAPSVGETPVETVTAAGVEQQSNGVADNGADTESGRA